MPTEIEIMMKYEDVSKLAEDEGFELDYSMSGSWFLGVKGEKKVAGHFASLNEAEAFLEGVIFQKVLNKVEV